MANFRRSLNSLYGLPNPLTTEAVPPLIMNRAPTTHDFGEPGQLWINKATNSVYTMIKVVGGLATWASTAGAIVNLVVTNTAIIGTTLTVSGLGLGVVTSSAVGLLTSNALTNGQLLIGSTGLAPVATTLTAGAGIGIVNGAGTITISAPGALAVQYTADDASIAIPDGAGNVNIFSGVNLFTFAPGPNTMTIDIVANPTFAGLITGQAGFTQSAGTTTITSDTNAAQAIYLHTNGGVNETIEIYADQSTVADAIHIHSDLGGVTLTSTRATDAAITLNATNAAGGVTINTGTGGMDLLLTNGDFDLETGTGAINIGVDAVAHIISIGNAIGASSLVLASGTGDILATSTDRITLDAVGVLELNSSGAAISIGNDAVAQNINIGTGAAARTIGIGNGSGATTIDIDAGTGACTILANATDHNITFGSVTGVSTMEIRTGTGAMGLTAGGILDINATGAVTVNTAGIFDVSVTGAITLDSTAGTIGIGVDADAFGINIGTGASVRPIVIGNVTGATGIDINTGTGGLAIVTTGAGTFTVDAGNAFSIDSTIASNVTVTGAGQDLTLSSVGGSVAITSSEAVATAIAITASDAAGGVSVTAGTGGFTVASGGLVDLTPDTDIQASPSAVSVSDVNVGVITFTGFTTAAAGVQAFTVTNALVSATSGILVTVSNLGANDAQMRIARITPAAGSFVVDTYNAGTQVLNGNCIISFMVLN